MGISSSRHRGANLCPERPRDDHESSDRALPRHRSGGTVSRQDGVQRTPCTHDSAARETTLTDDERDSHRTHLCAMTDHIDGPKIFPRPITGDKRRIGNEHDLKTDVSLTEHVVQYALPQPRGHRRMTTPLILGDFATPVALQETLRGRLRRARFGHGLSLRLYRA